MTVRTLTALAALSIANVASAATVTATGACPGPVAIDMQNFTPNGQFALLTGNPNGNAVVPGGPCAGTPTQLGNLALRTTGSFNGGGDKTITPNVPAGACSQNLQILDVTTCNVSPPVAMGSQCTLPNVAVGVQGPVGQMTDPSFVAISAFGIVENGRSRDLTFDVAGNPAPASAEIAFQFLDVAFQPLCTIRYDLSGAVVDNGFSTVLAGAPFVDPVSVTLVGGDSDCGRVSAAIFGSNDLRVFLAQNAWSIAYGPMQNAFGQDLEAAVVADGQNFVADWEPFVFSTYVTTTGSAASEIGYAFRFDRTCDEVELDANGTLVDLLGTPNGNLDDFVQASPFLVFAL